MARRAGWGIADQAFSSLTNFALGILVARSVGPAEFGAFSLAFAAYYLALNMSRSVTTQPLIVRHTGSATSEWRKAAAAATGTALLIGIAAGGVALVIASVTAGSVHDAFFVLGFILPGLLLQDAWRFAFFSCGRGALACANDLAWALVQFPVMLFIVLSGHSSIVLAMVSWGVAAGIAATFGAVQAHLLPRPVLARAWWRAHHDLSSRYVVEVIAGMGGAQISLYAVTAIAGLAVVGTLRAGELLLGPLNILFQGIQLAAVPEGVRLLRKSTAALRRLSLLLSGAVTTTVLLWGGLMWLVPDSVGVQLLGATWAPAHSVVVPLALALAAGSANMGAAVGLRALAAARRSMNTKIAVTAMGVSGQALGAALAAASGAAIALAITMTLGAVVYWRQYAVALRRHETDVRGAGVGPTQWRADISGSAPSPGAPSPP
ncbi:MAG: hypothetical protein M3O91_01215 [Chloroflexota bacterium]|nr:hypothetical protein [Chloroflexota bacterium]